MPLIMKQYYNELVLLPMRNGMIYTIFDKNIGNIIIEYIDGGMENNMYEKYLNNSRNSRLKKKIREKPQHTREIMKTNYQSLKKFVNSESGLTKSPSVRKVYSNDDCVEPYCKRRSFATKLSIEDLNTILNGEMLSNEIEKKYVQ